MEIGILLTWITTEPSNPIMGKVGGDSLRVQAPLFPLSPRRPLCLRLSLSRPAPARGPRDLAPRRVVAVSVVDVPHDRNVRVVVVDIVQPAKHQLLLQVHLPLALLPPLLLPPFFASVSPLAVLGFSRGGSSKIRNWKLEIYSSVYWFIYWFYWFKSCEKSMNSEQKQTVPLSPLSNGWRYCTITTKRDKHNCRCY